MIYLLDIGTLTQLIAHQPPELASRVDALAENDCLGMSFVTWGQLLEGAERSARRAEVVRRLEALAWQVPVRQPAAAAVARHYAEQSVRLGDAGVRFATNDLWVACHALAEEATLVTPDTARFAAVAGLRLDNWCAAPAR